MRPEARRSWRRSGPIWTDEVTTVHPFRENPPAWKCRRLADLVVYTSYPEALGALRARVVRAPAAVCPGRGLPGHFMRLAWLQTVLRVRARADGVGLLLNTIPEGILASRIPQVTVVHDVLPLFFPGEYPRQQYYFRFLVPRILRASRLVVTDSENTRRTIVRHYGLPADKVRVIHPGYDPRQFFSNGFDPFVRDLKKMISNLVRERNGYRHDDPRYSDCERGNAHAHLRAALLGRSVTVGVSGGELSLGRFQSIIFAEMDGPRHRQIDIQIMGE